MQPRTQGLISAPVPAAKGGSGDKALGTRLGCNGSCELSRKGSQRDLEDGIVYNVYFIC